MPTCQYPNAIRAVIDHLEQTQLPAIEQATDLIVDALTHGGAVFCGDIGHQNQTDFINRAGGLASVQRFTYSCEVTSPVAEALKDRPREEHFEQDLEMIRYAVRASNMRKGDVLLLGSVSGKNRAPVETALTCRELGIRTIGFTSMTYTAQVQSQHPSGKRLFEVVDVVIDDGAPYGDAAVQLPGYDFNLLPVSGASHIISGWMLWERVIVKMVEQGTPPSVFMSLNRAGGEEYYNKSKAEFQQRGY